MTRVLVIEGAGELWGSERALLDLVKVGSECEFAVCCPPATPLAAELRQLGVKVLPYFIAGLHRQGALRRAHAALGVLRACLAFRPHVIHLNHAGAYMTALPAATILGKPITAHIRLFEEAPYLAARKPDPRRVRRVIAISRAVAAEVQTHPELAALSVSQIYDGYSPPSDAGPPERRLNRIVCAGRIEPMKRQDLLLDALSMLQDEGAPAECVMAGTGDAGFVEALKGRGVAGVDWRGFVQDMPTLLRSASVLAFPSERETLGRVVMEAWAAGAIPVVFGGSAGAAEIVTAADGGVIYDDQTPASLAGALRRALGLKREERERLIANGRSWLRNHCSETAAAEAFARLAAEAAAA